MKTSRAPRSAGARRCSRLAPGAASRPSRRAEGYKVKRLVVEPGHRLSLQRHRLRAEHWVVVEGAPRVWVGRARQAPPARQIGDGAAAGPGTGSKIAAVSPTVIIEVQYGPYLGEDDIIRKHDDYGRTAPAASSPQAARAPGPGPRTAQRRGGSRAARYSRMRRDSAPSGAIAR